MVRLLKHDHIKVVCNFLCKRLNQQCISSYTWKWLIIYHLYVSDECLFPVGGSGFRRHARYLYISEICPISGGKQFYSYTLLPCKRWSIMELPQACMCPNVCMGKYLHSFRWNTIELATHDQHPALHVLDIFACGLFSRI